MSNNIKLSFILCQLLEYNNKYTFYFESLSKTSNSFVVFDSIILVKSIIFD